MNIENIEVKPDDRSIFPGMSFEIEISRTKYQEAIIGVGGWLETDDGKIVAEIKELSEPRSEEVGARGSSYDSRFKEEIYKTTLVTFLDKRALDHIERRRAEDRKGNVKLTLHLNVKSIENRAVLLHLYPANPEKIGLNPILVPTHRREERAEIIVSAYDPEFSTRHSNYWVLSGNSGPVFLATNEQNLRKEKEISSSDWIHDYAPKLELGEYFIVEIPKGVKTIEKAWDYIEKAEGCFRRWDTKGVYANCREVGSLLDKIIKDKFRNDPTIKKWKKVNENFNSSASLGLHTEDIKEQTPEGEVKVEKADTEHMLIVTKAMVKYAEELLQGSGGK